MRNMNFGPPGGGAPRPQGAGQGGGGQGGAWAGGGGGGDPRSNRLRKAPRRAAISRATPHSRARNRWFCSASCRPAEQSGLFAEGGAVAARSSGRSPKTFTPLPELEQLQRARPQSCCEARCAFDERGELFVRDAGIDAAQASERAKPQSVPAITRSRPTMSANCRSAAPRVPDARRSSCRCDAARNQHLVFGQLRVRHTAHSCAMPRICGLEQIAGGSPSG